MRSKDTYLEEMGIEVWRLRGPGAEAPAGPATAPAQTAAVTASVPEPALKAVPAGDTGVPEFSLAFLNYGAVGICVSLDTVQLPKRLCDDLARLLDGQPEDARFRQLDWPMVNSSAIDQSLTAAREVVTQKFSQLPDKVLVLGGELARYFGPAKEFRDDEPVRIGRQTFLLIPSLQALMTSAAEKRRLLGILRKWRAS